MPGEKDPRDVMQAEHDARLSEHPAFQAPAEMPGVEEIARAICVGNPDDCVFGTAGTHEPMVCHKWRWQEHAGQARAILDLFAPILAEKERLERNRDMWKGQCERQAKTLHDLRMEVQRECVEWRARALAAEAALAAERAESEQLQATIRKAHVAMTLAGALPGVASEYDFSEAIASTEAALARRAAAIRAQGPETP